MVDLRVGAAMNPAIGSVVLAIGFFAVSSPAQATSPLPCMARLQAAGINPSKLGPGDRGRLDGYEFIVAKDDTSAMRICARVDADKSRIDSLRSQLGDLNTELSKEQSRVEQLKGGGLIKDNYLVIEGCLLVWAIIATIWASYFAGRLDGRRRHSF